MSFVCALLAAANCWRCVVLFGKLSMSMSRLNLWLLVRDGAITPKLNAVHRPLFVSRFWARDPLAHKHSDIDKYLFFRSGDIDHFISVNFGCVLVCDFRHWIGINVADVEFDMVSPPNFRHSLRSETIRFFFGFCMTSSNYFHTGENCA